MVGQCPTPLDIFASSSTAHQTRPRPEPGTTGSYDRSQYDARRQDRAQRARAGVRTISKLATALGPSAAELFDGVDGRDAREADADRAR
jgi:hypothetical protein